MLSILRRAMGGEAFWAQLTRAHIQTYSLMFSIIILLNVDYWMLRSMRSALVVADLIGSASYLPLFELCGTLPVSILMTMLLGKFLSRSSFSKVFGWALFVFVSLLLLSVFVVYPNLSHWAQVIGGWQWLPGHQLLASLLASGFCMAFYVMGELWKVGLITLLLMGVLNRHVSSSQAKLLYVPLMLAGSIGAILAGPCIKGCTAWAMWWTSAGHGDHWNYALMIMSVVVTVFGAFCVGAFRMLTRGLAQIHPPIHHQKGPSAPFSLMESVRSCLRSPSSAWLAWIVIVDYVAYSIGEVIFLEVLKARFPAPVEYCAWMGNLSLWSGLLTAGSALFIAPWTLRYCRWTVAAMATPIGLLLTQAIFYFALFGLSTPLWFGFDRSHWLEVIVIIGSLQYSLCRAIKYTLFDPAKEIVFVLMPLDRQIKSKLIIDGICARLGRGVAALFSVAIFQLFGTVTSSAPVTSLVAMSMTLSWMLATSKLGRVLEHHQETPRGLKEGPQASVTT